MALVASLGIAFRGKRRVILFSILLLLVINEELRQRDGKAIAFLLTAKA
jgi:hypothetical protein